MTRVLHFIDSLSAWMGKAFAWCIVILTFSTCYEVFVRYVLNAPTVWAFDMSVQMYGALFMMAGAYALSQDAHVRGDALILHAPQPVRDAPVAQHEGGAEPRGIAVGTERVVRCRRSTESRRSRPRLASTLRSICPAMSSGREGSTLTLVLRRGGSSSSASSQPSAVSDWPSP